MIRKHIKVEPARWYTHCDRLGIIVWQDMPSGDSNPHGKIESILMALK
jgi:beta-galactosidase/beta-glucuronidase